MEVKQWLVIQKQTAPAHTLVQEEANAANVWRTTAGTEKYPAAFSPRLEKRLTTGPSKTFTGIIKRTADIQLCRYLTVPVTAVEQLFEITVQLPG